MRETRWDSKEFNPPELPYITQVSHLDDRDKLSIGSNNCFITDKGTISKRWGTTQYTGVLSGKAVNKIWLYETLPIPAGGTSTQYTYILMSVLDNTLGTYSLYYKKYSDSNSTAPTLVSALRASNSSNKPHKITFSKGLAYVKGFPKSSSSEKYGTIILDGSSGSIVVRPWGIPGPTVPARISGETIRLTAAVTVSATTFNTTTNTPMPATPYDLWIGYEKVTVTSEPTSTSLTVTRGAGGTTAEAHDANEVLIYRDWDASDHKVDVQYGWKYAFAYVSITGQVSNRSDVEYNPDLMPSNTGPFYDLIPKIDLTLDSWFYNDTTTYPYLNMYRTTDGGGTFYFLEQVANPGTSTYTYEDDSFGTGASSSTYNDPIPDLKLDTARYAPSLTSNSVPPTINPPGVVGTDTPSEACYAMTTYASRIWLGIDQYLHFSAREETRDGIGEECFPSGNLGNFFILDAGIVGMAATADALYVITTNDVWKVSGSTLDTFSINKISGGIGGYTDESISLPFKNSVAFVTKEQEFAIIDNDRIRIISKPISDVISLDPGNVNLMYYRDKWYEWLIWANDSHDEEQSPLAFSSTWYIYDLVKSEKFGIDFWHPIWQTKSCASFAARSVREETTGIITAIKRTNATGYTCLTKAYNAVPGNRYDTIIESAGTLTSQNFGWNAYLGSIRCPTGNHLHSLNRPSKDVDFYGATITHRISAATNATPTFVYWTDNNDASPIQPNAENPPRIVYDNTPANTSYATYFYPGFKECYRIFPEVLGTDGNSLDCEVLSLIFSFDPIAKP